VSHRSIAHIIWDWNGTLFDDAWLCREAINGLLVSHGLEELTQERYEAVFTFPVRDYYESAGFDLQAHSFEDLGAVFMAEYERRRLECALRPFAHEALSRLASMNVEQSVLSAYLQPSLVELVQHFELTPFFVAVTGASDIYAKGKVDRAHQHMKSISASPNQTLLIGDTIHDWEVAQSLDCHCALVHSGNQSIRRLKDSGAPVFDSLSSVITSI